MRKKYILISYILLISSVILYSCRPQPVETPSATDLARTITAQTNVPPATLVPEAETATPETARFDIEAPSELQEPVSALYETFFPGESPNFVEENGSLIAREPDETDANRPEVQSTFLPDAVLISETESADVHEFIDFAISVDGQRVLIENGYIPASISLTDQTGNTLDISQPVERIISTYGPATSFIYSVGGGNRLVSASYLGARDPLGAEIMAKIDPRFSEIMGEEFFTQQDFSVEQAATLDPDLIIGSARSAWVDTAEQLDFSVFLYDAETPDRLKEAMRLTGQMFGPNTAAQSEAWVTYYNGIVDEVRSQTDLLSEEERPSVLFTGTEPTRIASGDMYQTDIIEAAGGASVSAELTGFWNDVNLEQIVIWDPDVIIVPPYGGATVSAITDSPEWQILDAVQAGRVYQMPKLVVPWDTPAPDSVLGIVWLAQTLHPDLVDLDCGTEAEYFYNTFYDYSITEDEIESVCRFE